MVTEFRQGLKEAGYVNGQHGVIETRCLRNEMISWRLRRSSCGCAQPKLGTSSGDWPSKSQTGEEQLGVLK
jgi:hypothetical protein